MGENPFARPHPEDPEAEYASRILAERHLSDFVSYTFPRYQFEDFHLKITETLQECVDGATRRIMIFAPPQHGKSELVSIRFPAWWLGKRPDIPVILCSYGAGLAQSKAGTSREIIASRAWGNIFPNTVASIESRHYARIIGSRIIHAGVGGPITGFGGGLGIIDDPVKNYEEAFSTNARERVWKWWQSTFRTRIWEGGSIVLIMTRWHEDDLAGRLLNTSGERWKVLRFPAIAESQEEREDFARHYLPTDIGKPDPLGRKEGEPLAPKRYSLGELNMLKIDVGSIAWQAEYQGTPRTPGGNRVLREWFEIVNETPRLVFKRIRYWDKAGGAGSQHGWTAGVLMSLTHNGLYYIENVIHGAWSPFKREEMIKQTAILDEDVYGHVETWVEQEPGSGGAESALATIRNLAGFTIRRDKVSKSKEIRFEPFSVQAEAHNVYIKRAKWNYDYLEEITQFPNSTTKDMADASSGAFNKLVASIKKSSKTYRGTIPRGGPTVH